MRAVCITALAFGSLCFAADNPTINIVDQIVAKVNGDIVSQDEIVETIIQMAVYAGFPAALNGLSAAKEVFAG